MFRAQSKTGDVRDEPVVEPLGDIEAAERIRSICRSAVGSARQAAQVPTRGKRASGAKEQG